MMRGKSLRSLRGLVEKIKGKPLGGFRAYPRKLIQFVYKLGNRYRKLHVDA